MRPIAYLDTNALVKLYLFEPVGKASVDALIGAAGGVATSYITYPEAKGAFARALSSGLLTQDDYDERLDAFENDWLTLSPIELTEKIYRRAGDLISAHPKLRGMDAIQLSSALELRQAVPIRFLTFDAGLETVARAMLQKDELWP